MPKQPLSLVTSLLNLAPPDLFVFMVSSLFLSTTSRNESTWDLTNRICDRYSSGKTWKPADLKPSDMARIG